MAGMGYGQRSPSALITFCETMAKKHCAMYKHIAGKNSELIQPVPKISARSQTGLITYGLSASKNPVVGQRD